MNVSCPECRSVFRVDPSKVPQAGIRARCSVCGGVITIGASGSIDEEFASAPAMSSAPVTASFGGRAPTMEAVPPVRAATPAVTQSVPAPRAPTPPRGSTPAFASPPQSPRAAPPPIRPATTPAMPGGFPPRPAGAHPAMPARPAVPPRASGGAPVAPIRPAGVPPIAPRSTPRAGVTAQPTPPSMAPSMTPTAGTPVPPRSGAGMPTPTRTPINPFLANDPNAKARRLARALISDLVTYFPQRREEGIRDGTLRDLFREEIKKSHEEYVDQVGREFADATTHFQDALNDILAGGRKMF